MVWGLGALFYFTAFYHRVAPAVMTDRLMAEFRIGAAGLGNFTAFYFYSYFLMQIPTGILADHWGPRRLLAGGSLVTAAGTFLFAAAESIVPANLGRLLIGGASGVAFVSLLRLSTCWFPARVYATQSGLALFVGVSGAVTAGVPLHWLVEAFGWRPVMFAAVFLHLILGALIWLIVRDDPAQDTGATPPPKPRRLFRQRPCWRTWPRSFATRTPGSWPLSAAACRDRLSPLPASGASPSSSRTTG